jgi:hypothetical protein
MRKIWTDQEIEILRRLYPDCKTETLEGIFKIKAARISSKASVLGIKKSEVFKNSPLSGRISKNNDIGINTRFKNCQPGWNKGKKQSDYMSSEMIERTAKTRFKKGQDPHNTVSIGFERITRDGYVEVKVRHLKVGDSKNKNFELKNRIIYKENFGEIPKGMIVEFLNGDKMNFEPSNLFLRTRKENMLQNSYSDNGIIKRFLGVKNPEIIEKIKQEIPEIINQKRKTILLNQKINQNNAK